MAGAAVALVLTAAGPACRSAGAALFPGARLLELTREQLRPPAPFEGPLFALLAALPRGAVVGLVVPVLAARRGAGRGPRRARSSRSPTTSASRRAARSPAAGRPACRATSPA